MTCERSEVKDTYVRWVKYHWPNTNPSWEAYSHLGAATNTTLAHGFMVTGMWNTFVMYWPAIAMYALVGKE